MWFGSEISKDIDVKAVMQKQDNEFGQDCLFHTLLGIFEVESKVYQKELDILPKAVESK